MPTTRTRKRLVIDRRKWLRNTQRKEDFDSCLLNSRGKMCCLGFYAKQFCGATDKKLLDKTTPETVPTLPWDEQLLVREDHVGRYTPYNTPLTDNLMDVNDSNLTYGPSRELTIKELFKQMGIQVVFTH